MHPISIQNNMNAPGEFSPDGIEIIIAEDSPTQLMRLRHVLEKHGYVVITAASNGREALDALSTRIPSLVITDIVMPEMDGYELCRRIKKDPKFKDIPVILLTALSDPVDILHGLECGADNFIVKPYDEQLLFSRIHFVLENFALRHQSGGKQPLEVFFAGRKYNLTTEISHSIDLLLSTYETAVQKNLELNRSKELLEEQAAQLREKNAEMSDELEMARELQIAFLPRLAPVFPANAPPDRSALRFCHRYCASQELGGDFYDLLPLSDTQVGVLICDVMGHGIRAALVTAIVRGLVEKLREESLDPGKFMTQLNRSLCSILSQTTTQLFATALYAVIDTESGVIRWANAGHPAPIHVRRAEITADRLQIPGERPGPALGFVNEFSYTTHELPLAEEDLIIFFTDGLYELTDRNDTLYEQEQLTEAVVRRASLPTTQLFDELIEELLRFSNTGTFGDDMCIVGVDVARLQTLQPEDRRLAGSTP
jgi:serine phosphatase RsbU (regulator of sigma subunit)/ActR/RegA family two-component response regulator